MLRSLFFRFKLGMGDRMNISQITIVHLGWSSVIFWGDFSHFILII